jgi:1L-myo-inositol 1-phosphate cytidylyltransferase / CDP-L-myo-inositol myo-inositolphosphotransferase
LLLIVPGSATAPGPLSAATVVAGLPLVRRIALAGTRAGCDRLVVHGVSADGALSGLPAEPLAAIGADGGGRRRFVLLPANVVPRAEWLRQILSAPIESDTLYVDVSGVAVVETARPAGVVSAAAGSDGRGLLAALRTRFREGAWPLDEGGRFVVTGQEDVPRAETWLLRSLIKPTEGFMSRHVERRVSLALTRHLVSTRMTPNAMTLVSVGIGLIGAPFFTSSRPALQLAGALLFLTHSILDGCDGELARLKFLESRSGAMLDFWGDNAVHVAVFLSMAIGWSASLGAAWPLAVGAVAILATLGAASVLAPRSPVPPAGAEDGSWLARLTDSLANRDFIYLVVLLAAFGKAWWFLAVVAVGTPIFALLCLLAGRPRTA